MVLVCGLPDWYNLLILGSIDFFRSGGGGGGGLGNPYGHECKIPRPDVTLPYEDKPTWAEEESRTSSSEKQRKSRGLVITLELERNKALGKPWKNKSLGYIPSPKGERSKA